MIYSLAEAEKYFRNSVQIKRNLTNLPLSGKTVICTRPADDSENLIEKLTHAGARVVLFPVIEIRPIKDFSEVDIKLANISDYNGIMFTSANAAKVFLGRAHALGKKIDCHVYAVGEKTAECISNYGYKSEYVDGNNSADKLTELIKPHFKKGKKLLYPRGNLSMRKISEMLSNVDEVIVYETKLPDTLNGKEEVRKMLVDNIIDCVTFFSPSAVTNFFEIFPEESNRKYITAVIGKTTEMRAKELGLVPQIVAERSTSEELTERIIEFFDAK